MPNVCTFRSRTPMSATTNNSTRRDFLKTIGGVLGGISLLGHGRAPAQALARIPNGYKFYRISLLTKVEASVFTQSIWAISQAP